MRKFHEHVENIIVIILHGNLEDILARFLIKLVDINRLVLNYLGNFLSVTFFYCFDKLFKCIVHVVDLRVELILFTLY